MSVLFPRVNKPREWDYRPIYYDKEKEARKDKKLARLHHGSFREEHEKVQSQKTKIERQKSRLIFWIVLLVLLIFTFWVVL